MRPEEQIEFSISTMCSDYIIKSWVGLVLFLGLLLHLFFFEDIEFGIFGVSLVAFCGMICVLALRNLYVLYGIRRLLKRRAFPLLKAIYRKKSNAVLWIYQLNTTYTIKDYTSFSPRISVRRKNYIVVVMADGKKVHIKARSQQEVGELMEFLSEVFPHALMGYGPYQKADVEARIGRRIRDYLWFDF